MILYIIIHIMIVMARCVKHNFGNLWWSGIVKRKWISIDVNRFPVIFFNRFALFLFDLNRFQWIVHGVCMIFNNPFDF